MSDSTTTPSAPPATAPAAVRPPLASARAARELGLKRGEFDLAVRLGHIRTVPDEGGGGGRRVDRAEIDRVSGEDGFPDVLRERVRAVGTAEGAALMGITAARFTRLARLGLVVPVRHYFNRYRTVVWLYLAEELRQFVAEEHNAVLLTGRMPERLRERLDAGVDARARNWRGRRLGLLLREADGHWARAAAVAALLDPVHVAEIVTDPYERDHLDRVGQRWKPSRGTPGSPSADLAARITTAQDPDEIQWLRAELTSAVAEARASRPAPHPTAPAPAGHCPGTAARPKSTGPAGPVGPTGPSARERAGAHRRRTVAVTEPATTGTRQTDGCAPRVRERPAPSCRPPAPEAEPPRRLLGWLRRRDR
ncbi:DUF6397 family protein [Streptomyces minutiscleroticus]|uniref:Uncharacterized protein n=1 Tax=Streptomyces minutiscleroticus TaxID=68238 RepID=A0A918NL05_9ACTN|nr:DUF6397 family protein [Streptomyces minutiscleroticus]GGX77699.1 hypothetical protein GCM10010358_35090 [Streptomyces minutiscleroticus]